MKGDLRRHTLRAVDSETQSQCIQMRYEQLIWPPFRYGTRCGADYNRCMGTRRSPLRIRLAMVLACALAHQWGACPCGCPEHNRWLQAVQQWTAIGANAPAPIREELLLPGDACDHLPLAALHRAEDRHESRWADALSNAPTTLSLGIPCALAVSASSSGARQACSLRQCSPSGAARQAWLQVFLI